MILHLTDTRTGAKAPFRPADPTQIGLYVCGPTVYDRAHIGNARSAVVFDLLYRVLGHGFGPEAVSYARNFTDIDDKIMARAERDFPDTPMLEAISRLTRETTAWYHEDMDALGVLRPDFEPRATAHVEAMIEDIATMISRGGAYEVEGHVFFSVPDSRHRGTLSGRTGLDDEAQARIEPNPLKRHPADFVLWKPSSPAEPGWESPWGAGRPGWHIECSAMSTRLLGRGFDIHGGGGDLVFPHHDNEIAQAKCCDPGADYARTWLHNGMITVAGRKMSKSLGNVLTVSELRERLPGGAIRLGLLWAHYRADLDWSAAHEEQLLQAWTRWAEVARDAEPGAIPAGVQAMLLDDLNTAGAVAEMHVLAKAGDRPGLRAALDLMGVSLVDDRAALDPKVAARIEALIEQRSEARERRDFATSDRIRDALAAAGVSLTDGPGGTTWEVGPGLDAEALTSIR